MVQLLCFLMFDDFLCLLEKEIDKIIFFLMLDKFKCYTKSEDTFKNQLELKVDQEFFCCYVWNFAFSIPTCECGMLFILHLMERLKTVIFSAKWVHTFKSSVWSEYLDLFFRTMKYLPFLMTWIGKFSIFFVLVGKLKKVTLPSVKFHTIWFGF